MKPLTLTDAGQGTYLETEFETTPTGIDYWLKNVNAKGKRNVWRYHTKLRAVRAEAQHHTCNYEKGSQHGE